MLGSRRRDDDMRDRSTRPPATLAAAAVPTSAGTAAFCATEPTLRPALPTVDPTELPTPLIAPVTPLLDGLEGLDGLDGLEPALRGRPLLDDGLLLRDGEEDRLARAL